MGVTGGGRAGGKLQGSVIALCRSLLDPKTCNKREKPSAEFEMALGSSQ